MSMIIDEIKKTVEENDIVLYMKGDKDAPKCGFSTAVVNILDNLGLNFKSVDILKDENIRQGIKEFSNWPTLPQLYLKGEFVGGCDIVRELYQSGELQKTLKEKGLL